MSRLYMVINMSNRYAIIENGFVTNVVLADKQYAESQGWIPCGDSVGPGWRYDGVTMTEPPVVEPSYAEKRIAEYPPMVDYIDGIVKGDQAQVQAYIDACLAVKAKYPKE